MFEYLRLFWGRFEFLVRVPCDVNNLECARNSMQGTFVAAWKLWVIQVQICRNFGLKYCVLCYQPLGTPCKAIAGLPTFLASHGLEVKFIQSVIWRLSEWYLASVGCPGQLFQKSSYLSVGGSGPCVVHLKSSQFKTGDQSAGEVHAWQGGSLAISQSATISSRINPGHPGTNSSWRRQFNRPSTFVRSTVYILHLALVFISSLSVSERTLNTHFWPPTMSTPKNASSRARTPTPKGKLV